MDLCLPGGWGLLAYSLETQVDADDTQQYLSSASGHLEPDDTPWVLMYAFCLFACVS